MPCPFHCMLRNARAHTRVLSRTHTCCLCFYLCSRALRFPPLSLLKGLCTKGLLRWGDPVLFRWLV
jgi:hypothetical protein